MNLQTLHETLARGDLEKALATLKQSPDLFLGGDIFDNEKTLLHGAAEQGYKDVAEFLISNGADVNAKDRSGHTPLYRAAEKRHKGVAEFLLASGADVSAKSRNGDTLLHVAAEEGQKDVAEFLLANGADVNARDKDSDAPMHAAAANGHMEVVELLLANNADVQSKGSWGRTPLHGAAEKKYKEKNAGSFHWEIRSPKSPTLKGAAERGYASVTELLLAKGAEVSAKDSSGRTPLHYAAAKDSTDVAGLLLAKGAEVNAKDSSGRTPLHYAAAKGYADVAELLLAKGAEVAIRDNMGQTALHYAKTSGHKHVEQLLVANGADARKDALALKEHIAARTRSDRADALRTIARGVAVLVGGPALGVGVYILVATSPFSHAFNSAPSFLPSELQRPLALGVSAWSFACVYGGAKTMWEGLTRIFSAGRRAAQVTAPKTNDL